MPYAKLGAEIWRDYATDGVPASGAHEPIKSDMRAWMLATETALTPSQLVVTPLQFGAVGDGVTDDAPAFQDMYDALDTAGGGTAYIPGMNFLLEDSVECTGDNVTTELDDYAQITHDTPDFMALRLSGDRCAVIGGVARGFVGPAAWDPATGAVTPDYAVIKITGEECRVERTRIYNIRRVGIQFKDVNNGTVAACFIDGNQPSPVFPITTTVHFAVHFDNGTEASKGNFKCIFNTVKNCTQGCMISNYGSGSEAFGSLVAGNIFEGMWDHGVYSNNADGLVINANNFNDCHLGVAASGSRHVITGNAFVALSTGAGEKHVSGVSLRDPQYCIVSSNTFFGTLTTSSPICIDLGCFTTNIQNCVVSNNTIRTVGRGCAIRITERGTGFTVIDCVVAGNNIVCEGRAAEGLIQIEGPSTTNFGNIVRGNRLSVTGEGANGVHMINCTEGVVDGNIVSLDHNAGSAATTRAIHLVTCRAVKTANNLFVAQASFGGNVTFTGVFETGGTNTLNESRHNRSAIYTVAAGFTHTHISPASGATKLLALFEGTGAPTLGCRGGSQYLRTDGGAGTSFYVNEGDGANWAAK